MNTIERKKIEAERKRKARLLESDEELISDLAEFRAEIKELRAKVEEFLAFMKGLVSI